MSPPFLIQQRDASVSEQEDRYTGQDDWACAWLAYDYQTSYYHTTQDHCPSHSMRVAKWHSLSSTYIYMQFWVIILRHVAFTLEAMQCNTTSNIQIPTKTNTVILTAHMHKYISSPKAHCAVFSCSTFVLCLLATFGLHAHCTCLHQTRSHASQYY